MSKIAVVTGGSSGIGKETALQLKACGCTVYELSRTGKSTDGITHITCDITDEASVNTAISQIIAAKGKIDILVNNAGFGISGAAEFTDINAAKSQFDVNFFGTVRVSSAVLPYMRKAGAGRIVNLSSVAAVIPIPFQSFYSASKAAVNSYTMALSNEVKPFGIQVCAVMPGDIATGFTAARKKEQAGDSEYSGRISRSVSKMEQDEIRGMSAKEAGRYIAKIALKNSRKPLYTLRFDYKLVALLQKILPAQLLNFIIRILYAK